jgi:3-methylfumaryl-CoA hydratase
MTLDLGPLREWVGRSETASDIVTERLAQAYRATVCDSAEPVTLGGPAPAGIHWCLAPQIVPMSGIGRDGHPERGGFLPPVPLPRRMWAGSRIRFADPLRVGDRIERSSRVADVRAKTGASGELCFVTVEHVVRTERGEAVHEDQDLVFRDAPTDARPAPLEARTKAPAAPLPAPNRVRNVEASPVLLFRFSALTFNGHRIHYDRRYATEVEAYGGLVVHGPLQAALLLDLATTMRDGAPPDEFEFRAMRPLLDVEDIVLAGRWRDQTTLDLSCGRDADTRSVAALALWEASTGRVAP